LDNHGTHKVPKLKGWLARHPRYQVRFTATGASWLNLVETAVGRALQALCAAGQLLRRAEGGNGFA
jgi:hypothetical protein